MTQDKTPTDADLQSAYDSVPAHGNQQDVHIAGLRAVLAKWGSPVVAVEPEGWLYEWTHSSALGKPDEHFTGFTKDEAYARGHRNAVAVYTTPQPTRAQSGAVPLTQAKVVEAVCALPRQVQFITAFDQGVRFAERHHGIKGGQRGTE